MKSPTFGRLLRDLRTKQKLSVVELAAKAKLHRQTIYAIESGRNQPTWEVVQALANALGAPTDSFRVRPVKAEVNTKGKGGD